MNRNYLRHFTASLVLGLALVGLYDNARAGPLPNTPAAMRQQLNQYLFDAARSGSVPMLKEFAAAGYNLNSADDRGYTPLILAAYHGQAEAVTLLMQSGADPCAEDHRGNTALMGAIFKGEVSIARQLMAADCNPNHRNNAGQTPAMYAALFGRMELLSGLAARGADLAASDAQGNTAAALARGEIRVNPPR